MAAIPDEPLDQSDASANEEQEAPPLAAPVVSLEVVHQSLPAPNWDDEASVLFMLEQLTASGLDLADLGCYPITRGFHGEGAFCIPYRDRNGKLTGKFRKRFARDDDKYISNTGGAGLWFPPVPQNYDSDSLIVVEGEKKGAKYKKRFSDRTVVGIGGCDNFAGKDGFLLPELLELLRPGKKVVLILDADIEENIRVNTAARRFAILAAAQRCELTVMKPPVGKGADDWLVIDPEAKFPLQPVEVDGQGPIGPKLGKAMGLLYSETDKLSICEENVHLILQAYLANDLVEDKRLGLLYNGARLQFEKLCHQSVTLMQTFVNTRFKSHLVEYGLQMCVKRAHDTVQEEMKSYEWDGTRRLDTWGSEHFKSAPIKQVANEFGRLLITGMGLRILKPGTKFDYVPIFNGPQGIRKSSFWEDLATWAGHKYYVSCSEMDGSGGDAKRTQGGLWVNSLIVDLAEGIIFTNRKTNQDLIKQELTATADQYRPAFAKSARDEPRGFIFVGTTNRADLLSDFTGSRRFLFLDVTEVPHLPWELRYQLFAEVVAREREIRASNWFELNLALSDLPQALRDEHPHIADAQELINTRYQHADAFQDEILGMIEGGQLPSVRDEPDGTLYVTTHYFSYRSSNDTRAFLNQTATLLNALGGSPTFPYRVVYNRVSTSKLVYPPGVNAVQFLKQPAAGQTQGWWLYRKPDAPKGAEQK